MTLVHALTFLGQKNHAGWWPAMQHYGKKFDRVLTIQGRSGEEWEAVTHGAGDLKPWPFIAARSEYIRSSTPLAAFRGKKVELPRVLVGRSGGDQENQFYIFQTGQHFVSESTWCWRCPLRTLPRMQGRSQPCMAFHRTRKGKIYIHYPVCLGGAGARLLVAEGPEESKATLLRVLSYGTERNRDSPKVYESLFW